ncbi:MAG TPA: hypothetical protein VF173_05300 [Thermoanaerobaculia bacterium]|nr:hypothetical protein [Thermoanaerobaculia bacterium]
MAKKSAEGTTKRQFIRQGDRFKVWRKVSASVAANAADLPQAAIPLAALNKVIAEVDQVVTDQAASQASKQQASQRLKSLLTQGNQLTDVLKTLVRQHYGNGSDKLVEFDVQPFRGRTKPTVVPAPAPEPGAPAPTPTTPPISK